jgi:hypothetical protein
LLATNQFHFVSRISFVQPIRYMSIHSGSPLAAYEFTREQFRH